MMTNSDPGHGRGVAEVELDERVLPDVHGHGLGLAQRAALVVGRAGVEQQRLGEQLEPADGGDDDREQDRRAQQRDGDPAELLPRAGAVQRGRLVQVPRDGLHGRQVDQRVVAGPAPVTISAIGDHDDHVAACHSIGSHADAAEHPVDDPEVAAEQLAEHDRDRGDRGRHRGAGSPAGRTCAPRSRRLSRLARNSASAAAARSRARRCRTCSSAFQKTGSVTSFG